MRRVEILPRRKADITQRAVAYFNSAEDCAYSTDLVCRYGVFGEPVTAIAQGRQIVVKRLPQETSKEDLIQAFECYGEVRAPGFILDLELVLSLILTRKFMDASLPSLLFWAPVDVCEHVCRGTNRLHSLSQLGSSAGGESGWKQAKAARAKACRGAGPLRLTRGRAPRSQGKKDSSEEAQHSRKDRENTDIGWEQLDSHLAGRGSPR
eukprot:scaffold4161_cov218-Pinguiococcus_pyrenoidosus.AAC.4